MFSNGLNEPTQFLFWTICSRNHSRLSSCSTSDIANILSKQSQLKTLSIQSAESKNDSLLNFIARQTIEFQIELERTLREIYIIRKNSTGNLYQRKELTVSSETIQEIFRSGRTLREMYIREQNSPGNVYQREGNNSPGSPYHREQSRKSLEAERTLPEMSIREKNSPGNVWEMSIRRSGTTDRERGKETTKASLERFLRTTHREISMHRKNRGVTYFKIIPKKNPNNLQYSQQWKINKILRRFRVVRPYLTSYGFEAMPVSSLCRLKV